MVRRSSGSFVRTIADLSLRKPAATHAGILPRPGQVRLIFGNY